MRKKEANLEAFREKKAAEQKKSREKKMKSDPDSLKEREKAKFKISREKKKAFNPESLKEKEKAAERKQRQMKMINTDENKRRENYSRAIIFGPIFICSCCSRTMFENGVTKITSQFKEKVNQKRSNLFNQIIKEEIHVEIEFNETMIFQEAIFAILVEQP